MVTLTLCLLMLGLAGCFPQAQHLLWKEVDAPGGILRIEYDEPAIFGSHFLYFTYAEQGSSEDQKLGTWELNNDGANLGDHNLDHTQPNPQTLRMVLHGQQQEDLVLKLSVVDGKASLAKE